MRVAVLAGGPSSEHEVSLQTSAFVLSCLMERGHEVLPVLITLERRWRLGAPGSRFEDLASTTEALDEATALEVLRAESVTLFNGLHGPFGEDGQLQRLLSRAELRFTGSGAAPSELGMDKELSKIAASRLGAVTAKHLTLERGASVPPVLARDLGLPFVVKPRSAGSSVGVSLVRAADQIAPAVAAALAADPDGRALAEEYVDGVELACTVFRRGAELVVLPIVSVHPAAEFYDYEAKYASELTRYACPAEIPTDAAESIAEVSRALYEGLQLRGVTRIDFLLPEGGAPVFIELNTLPGFTSHSLVPMAARAAGLEPGELLEHVLRDTSEGGT